MEYVSEWDLQKIETNYLAVAWEALTALCKKGNYNKGLHVLLCELMKRCDINNGLFLFKDNSGRIDISGHVYRGFMNLM